MFLKVDTGFTNGELGIKAYVSRSMNIGSLQLGTEFAEIELVAQTTNLQKISSESALHPVLALLVSLQACTPCGSDNAWLQAMCLLWQMALAHQAWLPSTTCRPRLLICHGPWRPRSSIATKLRCVNRLYRVPGCQTWLRHAAAACLPA